MSKVSKTARASMASTIGEKKVIPDDVLVKQYREGREARLWPSLESSDAVLRMLDVTIRALAASEALTAEKQSLLDETLAEVIVLKTEFDTLLKNAAEQVVATAEATTQLEAAKARIVELEAEIKAAQDIFSNAAKSTEYSTLESLEAEAKNNHD